ncbi:MAG: CBS domain-containing protein [Pyrinomonadaceae bacterium]
MKVQDVMTSDAAFCLPTSNLADAAAIMWQKDCGIVPILDAENRVVGLITDRDAFIAAFSRDCQPSKIKLEEFCRENIIVCQPNEKIGDALRKMRKHRIKRLPVTSQNGELVGIISITDILSTTSKNKKASKKLRKKIVSTLLEIGKPRPILLEEI